jgi:hypothetical protein
MKKYPLTSTEMSSIATNFINYIRSKYPFLQNVNSSLSNALSSYQKILATDRPNILSYLKGLGYRNFGLSNVQVSYNLGKYM